MILLELVGLWILSKNNFYCKWNEKYFTSSAVAWEEKHFKGKTYTAKEIISWRERTKIKQNSQTIKIKHALSATKTGLYS